MEGFAFLIFFRELLASVWNHHFLLIFETLFSLVEYNFPDKQCPYSVFTMELSVILHENRQEVIAVEYTHNLPAVA